MSGELHEISAAIGELRAEVKHLHQCVHQVGERMDERCDKLEAKVDSLADDLTADKSELAKLKAKGAGVLVGAGAAAGYIGSKAAGIAAIVKGLGS